MVENLTVSWYNAEDGDSNRNWPAIENVSLQVKPGQLIAVVGPVGCGKVKTLHLFKNNCVYVTVNINFW